MSPLAHRTGEHACNSPNVQNERREREADEEVLQRLVQSRPIERASLPDGLAARVVQD